MENLPASVLIVEDDPTILEILIEGLTDEGYRTTGVTTLADAVTTLRASRFDIVLSDAFRPITVEGAADQWRVLAAMRAAASDTPTVLVTAHRLDDYAGFREHGFAAILGKPFDLDQLYETVRRVLNTPQ